MTGTLRALQMTGPDGNTYTVEELHHPGRTLEILVTDYENLPPEGGPIKLRLQGIDLEAFAWIASCEVAA